MSGRPEGASLGLQPRKLTSGNCSLLAERLVMTAIAETWAVSCTLMSLQPFPELAASARATVCQESSMSLRLTEPLATTARSKVGYVSKEAAAWSQGLWDSS